MKVQVQIERRTSSKSGRDYNVVTLTNDLRETLRFFASDADIANFLHMWRSELADAGECVLLTSED